MQKSKVLDLLPAPGMPYDKCKKAAQQKANETGRTIHLWHNVPKNGKPEKITPQP